MTVLAGDIGGTKTLLQLSEPSADGLKVCFEKRYVSADFPEFMPMVQAFAKEASQHGPAASSACFGVAGPVRGRTAKTTNLPWTLDADELESALNIPKVRLINDFQSVGYGIEALHENDLVTLQSGCEVPRATRVIIGAGTGLGHGLLVWQGDHYEVVASEAGHTDFAPTDSLQDELLQYLRGRFGQVTWERVVSGNGLNNLFDFLLTTKKGTESAALHEARLLEDPAAAISRFALSGQDALALQTMNLFNLDINSM